MRTEELSTVGNQLKITCKSILSGGGYVSTEYYPGRIKVQSKRCYSFKRMEDLLSNGKKSLFMLTLGVNRKGRQNLN